jgi:hexosaminidase
VIDLTSITPNDISALTIAVVNYGIIPEGAQGAGQKSWTFIDEIELQ